MNSVLQRKCDEEGDKVMGDARDEELFRGQYYWAAGNIATQTPLCFVLGKLLPDNEPRLK
jgi:hypothetical protein